TFKTDSVSRNRAPFLRLVASPQQSAGRSRRVQRPAGATAWRIAIRGFPDFALRGRTPAQARYDLRVSIAEFHLVARNTESHTAAAKRLKNCNSRPVRVRSSTIG